MLGSLAPAAVSPVNGAGGGSHGASAAVAAFRRMSSGCAPPLLPSPLPQQQPGGSAASALEGRLSGTGANGAAAGMQLSGLYDLD